MPADLQTMLAMFLRSLYAGTFTLPGAGSVGAGDGTSGLPSYSFTSEPTLGFWRSAASVVTLQGTLQQTSNHILTNTASYYSISGRGYWNAVADGEWQLRNNAATSGSVFNISALPTVASGFGTSPAVTAGSTPLAGSVNVGTGGVATSGVINFNGTAFPSAPFVVCMNTTTGAVVRAVATTTQLTITAPAAFVASDVISWICISSK